MSFFLFFFFYGFSTSDGGKIGTKVANQIFLKQQTTTSKNMNCFIGHLLQNSLTPLLIGHWVAEGQVTARSCNFLDANASNVFLCKGGDEGKIPLELAATIMKKFSFEGQWVLDLTCSNGELS